MISSSNIGEIKVSNEGNLDMQPVQSRLKLVLCIFMALLWFSTPPTCAADTLGDLSTLSDLGQFSAGNEAFITQYQTGGSGDNISTIDQSGSVIGHYADITQVGSGNQAYVVQTGDVNSAIINQTGSSNYVSTNQNGLGSSTATTDVNSISINQTGSNNSANAIQNGYGNSMSLTQTGNANTFTATQLGNDNSISFSQPGGLGANVSEIGNGNVLSVNQVQSQGGLSVVGYKLTGGMTIKQN
jgi:hypothetical protein